MDISRILKLALVLLLVSLMASGTALAQRGKKATKSEPMFPNATRTEPKAKPVQRLGKQLQKMVDLAQDDKPDEAIAAADEIIASRLAGPYEKSFAYQAQAFSWIDKDDYARAIPLLQKSLDENGLPNDTHYQIMYQLAQVYLSEEQYEQALTTLDRFMAETKTEKPEHIAMRGNALYRLDRFDEAAAALTKAIETSDNPQPSWSQLLMASYFDQDKPLEAAAIAEKLAARNPDDKATLMNLASIYSQSDQYEKAIEVLEKARAKGLLTEEREYRQLYALYLNTEGKEAQGITIINEGLQKGILKETSELYLALGQAYYFSEQIDQAIATYRKSLAFAKDGEPALNLARVLTVEADYEGARSAARDALQKGVKRPGDAWMVIGRAEHGLGNRAALVAAYREAAKHPETKQQAEEWLKKNGSK